MDVRKALTATAAYLILSTGFASSARAQEDAISVERAADCKERLQTCRLECRARILAVDPRRELCQKNCAQSGVQCIQGAASPQLAPRAGDQRL
jgi:hypothetical protein